MCQQKKLKMIALILAMNIMFIPILSAFQPKYNQSVVHAEETTINIAFFNAMLIMLGITSVMAGNMSGTFSIPETDLVALKDQFQATLDADATKKAAWMQAQTDYLAGGVAKTMGAVELAKIGIYDIYSQFLNYLKNYYNFNHIVEKLDGFNYVSSVTNYDIYTTGDISIITNNGSLQQYGENQFYRTNVIKSEVNKKAKIYVKNIATGTLSEVINIDGYVNAYWATIYLGQFNNNDKYIIAPVILFYLNSIGAIVADNNPVKVLSGKYPTGIINDDSTSNIINTTDSTISLNPTIPWIDSSIQSGTIVTPALSEPYAGTSPIDVPIDVPADDPTTDDPDVPSYPDVLSATIAILSALTPISALLDNINLGVGSLSDVIDLGNTAIKDGAGDIVDAITGTTTGVLTNIGSMVQPVTTSIENFFSPPSKDIDWDKLKNIQIFDKFPFSIPADLYFLMTMLASDPVAPKVDFNVDLSFIGASNTAYSYDLSQFDNFAQILRNFELLAFVLFMLYTTKNLIWK